MTVPSSLPAAGALANPCAAAAVTDVSEVVAHRWGLTGTYTAVAGERDTNFRLDSTEGRYLVKVTHPDEAAVAVDAQRAVLSHLQRADATLPVQAPVAARDGAYAHTFPADPRRQVRLVRYLPGTLRRQSPWQPMLATEIGTLAARLNRALVSFTHPGCRQSLLWDLRRATELAPLLPLLEHDPLEGVIRGVLQRLREDLGRLGDARVQPIHNDLNPSNLLLGADGRTISGVIDFGDMIEAPRVVELAVACAYLTDAPDLAQAISECAQAYHAHFPLPSLERQMLVGLIRVRWAMTVLITEWRARLQPENAAYILRNNDAARSGLRRLDEAACTALSHHLETRLL